MTISRSWLLRAALVISVCALPNFAAAQKRSAGTIVVDDLLACRGVSDPAARLACFDRGAAAFEEARVAKIVRVVDQDTVRKTKRSLFGLTLPDINLFGNKEDDGVPEIKEIESTIASVADRKHGIYAVGLADGSYWTFTEEQPEPPRRDEAIKIRKGALGSFMGSIRGRSGVRIKRER